MSTTLKPVYWVSSSKKDLLKMPPKADIELIRDRLKAAQVHAEG